MLLPTSVRGFNRQSVERALRKAIERLKSLPSLPRNGILLFVGEAQCEALEPPTPVDCSLYVCGKGFAIAQLRHLFEIHRRYCFVTLLPKHVLLWSVKGTQRTEHQRLQVALQTDSAKGGQSAQRFDRKRQNAKSALLKHIKERQLAVFGNEHVQVSGNGALCETYAAQLGTAVMKLAQTEPAAAMQETLLKATLDAELAAQAAQERCFRELLVRQPELCVFGDEVRRAADASLLRRLFVDSETQLHIPDVEICRALDLSDFGGYAGELYFATDFE